MYGDRIIVERTIRRDGASTYKLKASDAKKVISTKRGDLTAICDHFNIQIDNPISVLNQDMSKTLLNSTKDSDKYAFFRKATLLENIKSDYYVRTYAQCSLACVNTSIHVPVFVV